MRAWSALAGTLTSTLAALVVGACGPEPQVANPALWQVEDGAGHKAWLFGTIHTSDRRLVWQAPRVRAALDQSRTIVVEVANLADEAAVAATFSRLARSDGPLPPLSRRLSATDRKALAALLDKGGYGDGDFVHTDTWAAALTLARVGQERDDSRNGVDRAVIAAAGGRPVVELEGAAHQLELFENLPEREQRDLLAAVVREAGGEETDLAETWRKGDMAAIEVETRTGLLADPELRAVLFTERNRDWTRRIVALIRAGRAPFVAVGAAHMAGPQGLPAMLSAAGFKVTRIE